MLAEAGGVVVDEGTSARSDELPLLNVDAETACAGLDAGLGAPIDRIIGVVAEEGGATGVQ